MISACLHMNMIFFTLTETYAAFGSGNIKTAAGSIGTGMNARISGLNLTCRQCMPISVCFSVSFTHVQTSQHLQAPSFLPGQPQRLLVLYAPYAASKRSPANSVVVPVEAPGTGTVEVPVTQSLITRGQKAFRPAKVRRLFNVT